MKINIFQKKYIQNTKKVKKNVKNINIFLTSKHKNQIKKFKYIYK